MEMVADRKKLDGYWTREELEDAVEEGRIDLFTMNEYIRNKGLYMESREHSKVGRISKYARR